jgi:hypothetical protein
MATRYQRGNQKASIEEGQTTSMYAFWLPIWYLFAIVSSVLLQCMPSDYPFGIFWPLYRLSYFDVCLLITPLVSFGHCIVCPTLIYAFWLSYWYLLAIVSSVLLRCMPSYYPIGIFWPLYRLSYFDLCLLIIPSVPFGHCIVCPTSIYAFWLHLIQWPQDTKGVTRRHQSKMHRRYNGQKIPKG